MKTKKCSFILAVVIGCLSLPAMGTVEPPWPSDKPLPLLIGHPNPALARIQQLYVFIVQPDNEPSKDGLVWEQLQAKVEDKLRQGGVKCVKPRSLPTPQLRVYIDMLKLPNSRKYVFRIQTSLARRVILPEQRRLGLKADVWKTEPTMHAVSVQTMPDTVTNVVLEQVEAFTHAYLAANPPGRQPADANDISSVAKERVKPAAKSAVAEYKYVASKNSKVFHKPDCSSAKRIKPENLIGYNSRNEATKAGKRPCKLCKP